LFKYRYLHFIGPPSTETGSKERKNVSLKNTRCNNRSCLKTNIIEANILFIATNPGSKHLAPTTSKISYALYPNRKPQYNPTLDNDMSPIFDMHISSPLLKKTHESTLPIKELA